MRIGRRTVGDAAREVARKLDRPDVVVAGALKKDDHRLLVAAQLRRRNVVGFRFTDRAQHRPVPVDPHQLAPLRRAHPVREHAVVGGGEHGIRRGA